MPGNTRAGGWRKLRLPCGSATEGTVLGSFFDVTNPKKAKDHGAETRRGPEALQTGQTSNPDLLAPSSDGAR
jgi:hypothetical protein